MKRLYSTLNQRLFHSISTPNWIRPGSIDYLKDIVESRVYDVAIQTPIASAVSLSESLSGNNQVFFKREDLQPTFSFNIRGAHNKLAHLSPEQCKNGIISCSSGNHAQGVALAASKLGIDAIVVVPEGTIHNKIQQVEKYGAHVICYGDNFEMAQKEAFRIAQTEGRTLIHPFDDPLVIAGQGTIGLEIVKQMANGLPDYIFLPVGGGGLISGVGAFLNRIAPSVKIIGVEMEGANPMQQSLKKGYRVTLSNVNLFTDEASVHQVGREPFRICQSVLHDVITVSADDICCAIKNVFDDTRSLMEPLGALSVAGLKQYTRNHSLENKRLVAVLGAANMDFDRLRFVAERSDEKERFMAVTIPEAKGSFLKLYDMIFPRNVTEFSYRMHSEADQQAQICMSIQSQDEEDYNQVIQSINSNDMSALDISNNEVAKAHLRHLVGGRPKNIHHERIFRLEFPERPGALKEFLDAVNMKGMSWNVSLFHYRNHGADIGRVLVGFQVQPQDNTLFIQFLNDLNFQYVEETENIVYNQFLH